MNWHQSPAVLDRLAAEYALGTLHGGARRRFEAMMQAHPAIGRAVARWHERLVPIDANLPPMPAGDALWTRIEQRAFGSPVPASTASPARRAARPPERWWQRLFSAVPAGALAFGLFVGLGAPTVWQLLQGESESATQLPESYVGVLANPDGRPGMIVSSLRRGRTVDLKQPQPLAVPPGRTLVLWTLDAQGAARLVGPIPSGAFVSVPLEQPAEALFNTAVELAVSLEAAGAPPARPTSPYVYRGLCGKLWRVAPRPG
jgi:anti-sigma-K factor RskA